MSWVAAFVVFASSIGVAGTQPEDVGQWTAPAPWPVIAIHSALLPTGKVMQYAYPSIGAGSNAQIWEHTQGEFENTVMSTDIFCSGLSLLPDGKLFVSGGNDYDCEFQGRQGTHLFDPVTQLWTQLDTMTVGRWYPSHLTLGDGRVMIVSGLGRDCQTTPVMEIYTPGVGLEVVPEGESYLPLFPNMHLLTSGKVAYVGPGSDTWTFDLDLGQWEWIDNSAGGWRGSGTSVRLPGETDRFMIIGGESNNVHTNTCEIIDFTDTVPQWTAGPTLNAARAHANVVIMPDRCLFLVGGGTDGLYHEPVHTPEIYDPVTGVWTPVVTHAHGRMYHSTAVLLPDGRILSAGQDYGASSQWGEIYEPPYLFKGPRPTIVDAPAVIDYAAQFTMTTPEADDIDSVVLIRPTVVTHSINLEQRYVGLDFVVTDSNTLTVSTPPGGNHAPPGYYLLFILNSNGVPAVAPFLQLLDIDSGCPDVALCADTDGDAVRDDVCTWWDCADSACLATAVAFGDVGGSFSACPPDGFANIHDRNHVLRCFENTTPCSHLNIDTGAAFGACGPDGFCNVHDVNLVMMAFSGTTTCSCGPAPQGPSEPVRGGATGLTLAPHAPRVASGGLVVVDVFLDQPLQDLQSTQLQFVVSGGSAGELELLGAEQHDRRDYVFAGVNGRFDAVNAERMQVITGLSDGGVATEAMAYLGTVVFRSSPTARGQFTIDVAFADDSDHSWLIASFTDPIEITGVSPAVVELNPQRRRSDAERRSRQIGPRPGNAAEAGQVQHEHHHHDHVHPAAPLDPSGVMP
jgi:hypothetical protein